VRVLFSLVILFVAIGGPAGPATVHAQTTDDVAAANHPWGRFAPGAWKRVRVVTETLDEDAEVASTSVTETKTTLVKVGEESVTLRVEVAVDVAGKRFDNDPQIVKQGFHGELPDRQVKMKEVGHTSLTIGQRKISCDVRQIQMTSDNVRTTTKICTSDQTSPQVLRRETVTNDLKNDVKVSETVMEVLALDMPWKVLAEIKSAAYTRTVSTDSGRTTTTFAVTVEEIPGAVVCHSSKELDANGRVVRRSTLELVDYGLKAESGRMGLFHRLRQKRWSPASRLAQ
jgi:hypothetical protein